MTYILRLVTSTAFLVMFPLSIHAITLNAGNSGLLSGSVDYNNSDFIEISTVGAGTFTATISPDNYDMDLDCGLTLTVGPSDFNCV